MSGSVQGQGCQQPWAQRMKGKSIRLAHRPQSFVFNRLARDFDDLTVLFFELKKYLETDALNVSQVVNLDSVHQTQGLGTWMRKIYISTFTNFNWQWPWSFIMSACVVVPSLIAPWPYSWYWHPYAVWPLPFYQGWSVWPIACGGDGMPLLRWDYKRLWLLSWALVLFLHHSCRGKTAATSWGYLTRS